MKILEFSVNFPIFLEKCSIISYDRDFLILDDVVLVFSLVPPKCDTLKLNRLAGSIDGPIGEENYLLLLSLLRQLAAPETVSRRRADSVFAVPYEDIAIIFPRPLGEIEKAVFVGGGFSLPRILRSIAHPEGDIGSTDRFAGIGLQHEALELIGARAKDE